MDYQTWARNEVFAALREGVEFEFSVGGSAYFGLNTATSDFDFYALKSPELEQFLCSQRFVGKVDERYPLSATVFKHPAGVDVIALPQDRLSAVLCLQETMLGELAVKLYKLPKDIRVKVTPLLYDIAINAMLKFKEGASNE